MHHGYPGAEFIRWPLSPQLAPVPSQVIISRRWCSGGTAVIAASIAER